MWEMNLPPTPIGPCRAVVALDADQIQDSPVGHAPNACGRVSGVLSFPRPCVGWTCGQIPIHPSWNAQETRNRYLRVERGLAAFSQSVSKEERKRAKEENRPLRIEHYKPAQGSIAQMFAVWGNFFQHAIDEGFCEHNPFRAVKKRVSTSNGRLASTRAAS